MIHIAIAQEYNDAFSSVTYIYINAKNKHALVELLSISYAYYLKVCMLCKAEKDSSI